MNGRPWSKHAEKILRDNYASQGPQWCAKRLKRTINSVRNKAVKMGVTNTPPPGMVFLTEVDPRVDVQNAQPRAVQAARDDGVLETCPHRGGRAYIVPEEWADQYASDLGKRHETRRRTRSWLTTEQVAQELGVHRDTVTTLMLRNVGVGRALAHVRRVKITTPRVQWRYHPSEAREAIRRWKATR